MWNLSQCRRLAVETKLLDKHNPRFKFFDERGKTYVEGPALPRTHHTPYRLRLQLTPNYPWEKPHLYVIKPKILSMHNGGTINECRASHRYHMLGCDGPDGCVEICFVKAWETSMTINGVLCKGELWIKAYCEHLRTGRTIDSVIQDWAHQLEPERSN